MGCVMITKRRELSCSPQISKKFRIATTTNEGLPSSTHTLTLIPRENFPKIKCLKIKILDKSKISSRSLNLEGTPIYRKSLEFIPDHDFIKSLYSVYSASLRNFFNKSHEACIENFKLKDGITLMIVSLLANRLVELKYLTQAPYVEVYGTLNKESDVIYKDWKVFNSVLDDVLVTNKDKIEKSLSNLSKFAETMEEYGTFSLKPAKITKGLKIIRSVIEVGHEMLKDACNYKLSIKNFFGSINKTKKTIKKLGDNAAKLELFSGEEIVHNLFSRVNYRN